MAALHKNLNPWQRILLGILCFPLLPFYLCVYCFCLKDDKREQDIEENRHTSDPKYEAKDGTKDQTRILYINKGFQHHDEEKQQETLDIHEDCNQNQKVKCDQDVEIKKEEDIEEGPKYEAKDVTQQDQTRILYINKDFQHHDEENRQETLRKDSILKEVKKEEDIEEDRHSSGPKYEAKDGTQQDQTRISYINKGFQHHDEENHHETLSEDSNIQKDANQNQKVKRSRDVDSEDSILQEEKKHKSKPAEKSSYAWDGSNLKSLKVNLKALEELDQFASKLDTKGTVEQLVQVLMLYSKTELEKTRAIWIWICYHIEYDTEGFKNTALRSSDPNDVLRTRKGVCAGYASLFQHMCSIAGLQCKQVSGYAKGAGYKIGLKITKDSDHAWNMIYLEGSWHLLDSTWGAGHVDDKISKFTFKYNELFFLTHPAIFIRNHLPEEPDCQLLETPITREQYEKKVCPEDDYYNLNMVSCHPQTCVIETVKGKVSIAIESSSRMKFIFKLNETETSGLLKLRDNGMSLDVYPKRIGHHILSIFACKEDSDGEYKCIMKYRVDCSFVDTSMFIPKCLNNPVGPNWISEKAGLFNPNQLDPVIYTDDGCCTISFRTKKMVNFSVELRSDDIQTMPNHVILSEKKDKVEFIVRVPRAGAYALLVFDDVAGYICNYLVICSNPAVKWPPFPSALQNPVGSSSNTKKAGLLQPSHPDPIIHADDGCCTISFRTERMVKIIVGLRSDDIQTMPNHVILSLKKNKVEFLVHLPRAGDYALLIFDDVTGYIGNYLLVCSNPSVKWQPFPSSLQNPVGPSSETEKAGLLQPSHPDPIIHADDGCCTISFRTERMLKIIVNLRSDDIQKMPNHVILSLKKKKVEFLVHLPRAGAYALLIFDDVTGYIGNYLIVCSNPSVKWPAFPSSLQNPVGPSSETEKAGLLQPSYSDPVICTEDGTCTISFALKDIAIYCTLDSDEITLTEEMKRRHVFQSQNKDKMVIKVHLPSSGTYVLQVFIKPRDSTSSSYSFLCNYLITCTNTNVKWPEFPLTYNKWDEQYELVCPLEGVLPRNDSVFFRLKITGVTAVFANAISLTFTDNGYWEGSCSTEGINELIVSIKCIGEPNYQHYILKYTIA